MRSRIRSVTMPTRRLRLGEAIRAMRKDAGLEQKQLADRVNKISRLPRKHHLTQPRISVLELGLEPLERDLANLMAIDVACGHRPGHALELAGYLDSSVKPSDDGDDVEQAIRAATDIDAIDRQTMLVLYRSLKARYSGPLDAPDEVG